MFTYITITIRRFRRFQVLLIVPLLIQTSCKKLVKSPPPTNAIAESNVYSTDATAIAVLNGLYTSMNANLQPIQGTLSIGLLAGLSADEYTPFSEGITNTHVVYCHNALSQTLGGPYSGANHWAPLYQYVFRCNAAIEGLQKSDDLNPGVKKQLMGEAYFLRAFFYFYLVNLFGDLPLVITTDPEINTKLSRSSRTVVYEQIIRDLQEAATHLSTDYLNITLLGTTTERIRPTQWAAKALLARVYLYTRDYAKAIEQATQVISHNALFGNALPDLKAVFLKNSQEAIWQLQPTAINFNTQEARTLVVPATGPNVNDNPVSLSKLLLNSFETGDLRAQYGNWIDTTIYQLTPGIRDTVAYPYKYKLNALDASIISATGTSNIKEYFMMLRLGEQYLIRAEARVQQGDMDGAKNDLNAIRQRAGLASTTAPDKDGLLTVILHERQVELFSEWGHRWLDLKRTGKVDEVMSLITPLKANGAPWHSYQQLYPLPLLSDLQKAPNLVQNEGY